jgi:hypothetical protein
VIFSKPTSKIILVVLPIILIPNVLHTSFASEDSPIITGNDIYGKPLENWAQDYWRWWATTSPEVEVPVDPVTNFSKCVIGTDTNNTMLFLRDSYDTNYVTRCSLPVGKPILVPLLIAECDPTVEDPRTKTGRIEDLWACAKDGDETLAAWNVVLDNEVLFKKSGNEQVNEELKNRILVRNSSIFTINLPEVNKFEVQPGSYPAVVDGYYLILKPLSTGEHVLKYSIVHENRIPGAKLSTVSGQATYYVTVS